MKTFGAGCVGCGGDCGEGDEKVLGSAVTKGVLSDRASFKHNTWHEHGLVLSNSQWETSEHGRDYGVKCYRKR